jgi:hypothetical protein
MRSKAMILELSLRVELLIVHNTFEEVGLTLEQPESYVMSFQCSQGFLAVAETRELDEVPH